jgi:hypothetical protein
MQLYYDSYSFYLALLYVLLTLVSGFQITRIFINRHNRFHYQFGFLAYNFIWGILRSIFWLFLPWSPLAEILLEGLAVIIQVATYSFLVLYYAEVAHKIERDWPLYKKRAYLTYILFNVVFLTCFGIMVTMAILYGGRHPYVESGLYIFVASIYFLLVAFLAIFGWKMYKAVANAKQQTGYFQKRGLTQVVTVTIIVIIAFFSRAIKDAIAAFKIGIIEVENPHDEVWRQVVLFCLFFIWEIAPTALVNLLFWHIPKQNITATKSRAALFGDVTPYQSIRHMPEEPQSVKQPKRPAEVLSEKVDLNDGTKTKYGSAGFTKYSPYNTSPVVQDYLPSSHPNQPFRISIYGQNNNSGVNLRPDLNRNNINTDADDLSDE